MFFEGENTLPKGKEQKGDKSDPKNAKSNGKLYFFVYLFIGFNECCFEYKSK